MFGKDKYASISKESKQTTHQNPSIKSTSDCQNDLISTEKQDLAPRNEKSINNKEGSNLYFWNTNSNTFDSKGAQVVCNRRKRQSVENNPNGANQYRWDLQSGAVRVNTINPALPKYRTDSRGWALLQEQSGQKHPSTTLHGDKRKKSLSSPAFDILSPQNSSPELQLFCDDNGVPYGENSYEEINQAFETLLQQNLSLMLKLSCDDNEVSHEGNSNEPMSSTLNL
ncbi:hypothetical protein [Legionella rowbothamii]|uniref:hypothetical protein n=1 Tax=Legionella rowbothamii TaxID=96229 RepID=UPI001056BD95|nr:hypothetical protein [Legionella rowbothamii]